MNSTQLRRRYIILLKKCVQFYHEKSENQPLSYSHMRKALLFMEEFPQRCFEETGVELYKHKDIVLGGDLTKIYDKTLDPSSIDELPQELKGEGDKIVHNMVVSWRNVTPDENKDLIQVLLEALNIYINYVSLEKEKQKIKT